MRLTQGEYGNLMKGGNVMKKGNSDSLSGLIESLKKLTAELTELEARLASYPDDDSTRVDIDTI